MHVTTDPNNLPLLLTVPMAAEVLGISRGMVNKLIASGELESKKVGRLRRIPREAILKLAS